MEPTLSIGSGTGVLGPWKFWLRCFPLLLLNLIFCERYKGIASSACSSHWYQCHALTHTSLVWMYFPLKYTIQQPKKLKKISIFHEFPFSLAKFFCRSAAVSILMPPTFQIASLNCYTPKFSAVTLCCLECISEYPTRRHIFANNCIEPKIRHLVVMNSFVNGI